MESFLFLLLGFGIGSIGTLIGAGGGFILTPVLLFVFPSMAPVHLTSLSLLTVAANSTSGSIGYALRRQVHWPSVVLFSIAAVPGVILGVILNDHLSREKFEIVFAFFLLAMSVFVISRSFRKRESAHHFTKDLWNTKAKAVGSFISAFVGVISSLLGIGGGIIHVPLLAEGLKYPIHIAAGTSHAILAITSIVAVVDHFFRGDFANLESWVPFLVVGLIFGAQVGAHFSKKVKSNYIFFLLGAALFSVAVRLLVKNL